MFPVVYLFIFYILRYFVALCVFTENIRTFEHIFILLLQLAYIFSFSPTSKYNLFPVGFLLQFDTKVLRYESVLLLLLIKLF